MKPNCKKCFYGGSFYIMKQLAHCKCEEITEPTETLYNEMFRRSERYVHRKKWDEECECENFIPSLHEDKDYELEEVLYFETNFDCPFCGENVYVSDIGIETVQVVECEECGKKIAIHGKSI